MRSFAKVSSFCLFPAFLLLAACLAKPAASAVWVVDPEGSGDATTIQGGIDLASVGDVVQVRPGVYSDTHSAFPPWGERIVNVEMKPGVRVESTDGPAETIIDGAAKTAQYGVYFPEGCAADCALVGFSIDHSQVGTYVNTAGDYTLHEGSPASPENSDCGGMGAFGVGCGPTPVLETSWGKIKHAFDFHR